MPAITSEAIAAVVAHAISNATVAAITAVATHHSNNSSDGSDVLALQRRRFQPDASAAGGATALPPHIASIVLSNFLPASLRIGGMEGASSTLETPSSFPTFSPPSIENLVASSAEDLSNFRDVSFDIFNDDDDDLFGSPLTFDASETGLWNGRFVPPPPRPPFFVDEPVLSDGLTTCDLCSWAMPTKSTFIFEGTIEKASELGWPLTLIIVSILSALFGAIIMITVVRCRRKKASNNRNETHVQWWSRNKRPHSSNGSNNNNHLRRSNIYTAHPADSIRGLQQPSLSAASSLTAMTAMGVTGATSLSTAAASATAAATIGTPGTSQQQQQQYYHPSQHQLQLQQHHHPQEFEYEHEYHQPQELQLQLQQHQRQHSSSMSSAVSTPSLTNVTATQVLPVHMHQPQQHHQQPQQHHQQRHQHELHSRDDACHWPTATMVVAS